MNPARAVSENQAAHRDRPPATHQPVVSRRPKGRRNGGNGGEERQPAIPVWATRHFLLYAFDLLERICEEAWADPEGPKSEVTGGALRDDFETLDDLRRVLPKLIIQHNLHGIDIDPRAVQIGALALWLRAQKTWNNSGLKAAERPRIAKSNIVTAEPMPGEEDMRREFTAGLKPRVLGQIVDVVFEKMKLAGEAGLLLKIEEEIKDAVSAAGRQ